MAGISLTVGTLSAVTLESLLLKGPVLLGKGPVLLVGKGPVLLVGKGSVLLVGKGPVLLVGKDPLLLLVVTVLLLVDIPPSPSLSAIGLLTVTRGVSLCDDTGGVTSGCPSSCWGAFMDGVTWDD